MRPPDPALSSVLFCSLLKIFILRHKYFRPKYLIKVEVQHRHALPSVVIGLKCFALSLLDLPFIIIINHREDEMKHGYSYFLVEVCTESVGMFAKLDCFVIHICHLGGSEVSPG